MVNVNETTPKLTRPEQTTQKCHQTAFKISTLQQCPDGVSVFHIFLAYGP
jgi:hypothetical protein